MVWIAAIADEVVDVLNVSFALSFLDLFYERKLWIADLECEDVGRNFRTERRNYWTDQ